MAQEVSHKYHLDKAENISKIINILIILSFFLSVTLIYLEKHNILNWVNIVSFLSLALLEIWFGYHRESGERIRRKGLMDNSYNTNFNHEPTAGYYDNEEIKYGFYKMIVNLFENTFFSLELTKKQREKHWKYFLMALIGIICLAMYGFANSIYTLSFLQIFLSSVFIKRYLALKGTITTLESIFEKLKEAFDGDHQVINSCNPKLILILIEYECNISEYKPTGDSKLFDLMNPSLTSQWSELKNRYNIKS